MDSGRQLFRYGIPGTLLLLAVVVGQFCLEAAWDLPADQRLDAFKAETSVLLAALVATIPIGFIVYQLYYFSYGPRALLLRRRRLGYVTRDRGALVLKDIQLLQLEELRARFNTPHLGEQWALIKAGRFRRFLGIDRLDTEHYLNSEVNLSRIREAMGSDAQGRTPDALVAAWYAIRWRENWEVTRVVMDRLASDGRGAELKKEYTSLSDIFHCLGASRWALFLSVPALVGYNLLAHWGEIAESQLETAVALFLVLVVVSLLIAALQRNRNRTEEFFLACLSRSVQLNIVSLGDDF